MLQFYQALLLFTFLYLIWDCYNANRLLLMCEDDQRLNAGKKNHSAEKLWSSQKNLWNFCVGGKAAACVPPLQDFAYSYRIADRYLLLACAIEKNFSTVLTAIFCFLFDGHGFLEDGRDLTSDKYQFRFCANRNEYDSLATIYEKFKFDPNVWDMIAVVRDPFERFVSGFADKCLRQVHSSTEL
ncbi:hypothetical protein ANCDUO_24857 [Ancylostoma duodenale]|uniref:Sulfotransferase domain-containing protein n=1 Tax=Ancylostoma duodenale TaxID=51022 RepID=A0A0C2C619_9BILA|nr:hypothetical protein ANCDUO_24857 [Ancylostoma duodenale]